MEPVAASMMKDQDRIPVSDVRPDRRDDFDADAVIDRVLETRPAGAKRHGGAADVLGAKFVYVAGARSGYRMLVGG